MKTIPIIILSENSKKNLEMTLKSLSASNIEKCPVIVCNNQSENQGMKEFFDIVGKQFTTFTTNSVLDKKYYFLFGVNAGFSLYKNVDYCCVMTDNFLFNPKWLEKMSVWIKDNQNFGLCSCHNPVQSEEDTLVKTNEFSADIWLVSNRFYKNLLDFEYFNWANFNEEQTLEQNLVRISNSFGLPCIKTTKSYVKTLTEENKNFVIPYSFNKKLFC